VGDESERTREQQKQKEEDERPRSRHRVGSAEVGGVYTVYNKTGGRREEARKGGGKERILTIGKRKV
jgi:hypothetical protein